MRKLKIIPESLHNIEIVITNITTFRLVERTLLNNFDTGWGVDYAKEELSTKHALEEMNMYLITKKVLKKLWDGKLSGRKNPTYIFHGKDSGCFSEHIRESIDITEFYKRIADAV